MYLKSLQLFQFKNHTNNHFKFSNKVICFTGDNGTGKTNILDAIHYLCKTKSYFNHIDAQNIEFSKDYFMLKGFFLKNERDTEVQCNVKAGEGKTIKNNQKRYKRFSDHIGKFPVVIISPTDTNLIIEGSEIRRKYLDNTISQCNVSYLQTLINYNKILKQRNSLLKQFNEKKYFDEFSLNIYNEKLVEYGNTIYKERISFIKQLNPVFQKYYEFISESREEVELIYKSQLIDNDFSLLLKESLEKDRFSNFTQCGIHKDDMLFKMNNYSIKKIGSQGQQKSFLVALKLAQFEFLKENISFKPILLLDDIFDKLDKKRVLKLISFVNQNLFGQVFITDTQQDRCEEILSSANISSDMFVIKDNISLYEKN